MPTCLSNGMPPEYKYSQARYVGFTVKISKVGVTSMGHQDTRK